MALSTAAKVVSGVAGALFTTSAVALGLNNTKDTFNDMDVFSKLSSLEVNIILAVPAAIGALLLTGYWWCAGRSHADYTPINKGPE